MLKYFLYMKKNYTIYSILIILLLSSGCSNSENVAQVSGGLNIDDFSSLPKTVLSGENVKLIYEVTNNGDYDTDVELYLQQIAAINDWKLTENTKLISSLIKKHGKEIGFFQLTAPQVERNTKQTYNAELKICYPYTTKTVIHYKIINSIEKEKEIEQGKYHKKLPFFKNSLSPLLIYPLTKEPLFGGIDKAIISFKVKNEKKGMLVDLSQCKQNPDAMNFNEFRFKINAISQDSDKEITIDCDDKINDDEGKIRLVDDSAIFYCTLTGISDKHSVTLTLESNYCYYQTKNTRIIVNGI